MIIAVPKICYNWVEEKREFNVSKCFIGISKSMVRRAIEVEGGDINEFVFFTDKTRAR